MCWQTAQLFQLSLPPALYPFVFFSTLCSYSFHWYLSFDGGVNSSRQRWMKRYRPVYSALFLIGIAGVIVYTIPLLNWWLWLLLSAFITFLYSAPKIPVPLFRHLRKVAYGKTIFLALVWTHVTSILPVVTTGQDWNTGVTLWVTSRFFLIYSICILFDYRDREYDRSIGIRSLITWLNVRQIARLFVVSIALFIIATCSFYNYGWAVETIILLLLPGIFTALSYRIAIRNFSDFLYYAWLDGLMALSAFLMWLITLKDS